MNGAVGFAGNREVKCSACPDQAFLAVDDVATERHLRGTDPNGAPFVMGVYPMLADNGCSFLPRISTKGIGEGMPLRLGTPANVMEYLLPLSGPYDPETVLTPGYFSTSRSQWHWRAVSGPS